MAEEKLERQERHETKPQAKDESTWRTALDRIDHEFREMERRMDAVFQDLSVDWNKVEPLFHGWTLVPSRAGPPLLERFGNLAQSVENLLEGWRRPFLTYARDDKKNAIEVKCELPGVTKEDIDITVQGDTIDIVAETDERKYRGRVSLGEALDAGSAKAHYANGVLRIDVGVVKPPKPNGKKIKVT